MTAMSLIKNKLKWGKFMSVKSFFKAKNIIHLSFK